MKASEMTNEMLAKQLDGVVASGLFRSTNDFFREAAARLRKYDGIVMRMRQVFKPQFEMRDAIIAAIRAKLKVAEDALEKCKTAMCNYCRSTPEAKGLPCLNGCETLAIAKNALAEIHKEGDVK